MIDEKALEKAAQEYMRINKIVCTPSLRSAIQAYLAAASPAQVVLYRDAKELDKPEGQRTKAEEWEGAYAMLFSQLNPVMEENKRLKAALTAVPAMGDDVVKALEELAEDFNTGHESEYCKYVDYLKRDECLGEEAKMAAGKFGKKELEARIYAAELYGKSLAYAVCAKRAKAALAAIPAEGWDSENKSLDAAMESMGAHAPSPAEVGMGSPVRYTDGTVSREYEEQPAGGVQSLNISDNHAQKETNIEHSPAPADEAWQPIETAPKAGQVLIYTPHIGVETAIQLEAANRAEPDNKYWAWFVGQSVANGGATKYSPTHWMPLPEPPAALNQQKL